MVGDVHLECGATVGDFQSDPSEAYNTDFGMVHLVAEGVLLFCRPLTGADKAIRIDNVASGRDQQAEGEVGYAIVKDILACWSP